MRWLKLTGKRQLDRDEDYWPLPIEVEKQGLEREETYLYWSNDYPVEEPK